MPRRHRKRNVGLKDLVNDALRRGLDEMPTPAKQRKRFRTRSVDLGRPRLANIDNIAEVPAIAEGEDFR
jgi:hypothetical protein